MIRKFDQLRLTDDGVEALEEWAADADEADTDDLYGLLFTVADSSLLRTYPLVEDDRPGAISVLVRQDLAVSLTFPEPGTFAVLAIGDPRLVLPEGC